MKSLRFILRYMKNYRYLLVALCFMVGEGLSQVFGAVSLGKIADVLTKRELTNLLPTIGLVLTAAAALFLCIFAKDSLMGYYLENGVKNLRREIVKRITGAKYLWLKKQPVGELLSRSMGDTEKVAEAVRPVLVMGVSVFGVLLIIVLYMLVQNWMLTLVFLVLIPLFMVIQWVLSGLIKKYHKGYLSTQADLTTLASESSNMQEIIKSLNAEEWVIGKFSRAAREQLKMERGEIRIQTILAPVNILCTYLPLIALVVIGGVMVQQKALTLGELLSFIVLGQIVSDIMGDLAGFVTHVRRMEVVTTRIVEWWNIPQEPISHEALNNQRQIIDSISCAQLSFAYGGGKALLKGIDVSAHKGERIAIVGPSGSGKSTLLTIFSTLEFPASGEIKFNGRPISEWAISNLRQEIAYVEQQPYFFPGTIRENLECGTEYSEEDMDLCLKLADAIDFVASFPQGSDTLIGERGADLSGGQKQRLAIARALLKKASVLLLDEATSALDQDSETKVVKGLLSLSYDPIILFVTHKVNTAAMFDRQWIIANGALKEETI